VPSAGPRLPAVADDGPIDAGWLSQAILTSETRDRGERIDQLAFGQRVFHDADPAAIGDVLTAIRAFPRFRMLMLTLERLGVHRPSLHASAARRAQQLSNLDSHRAFVALGEFQGALALVARMSNVHTFDAETSEQLITSLVNVPLNGDGRYAGGIAKWIREDLRRALMTAALSPGASVSPLSCEGSCRSGEGDSVDRGSLGEGESSLEQQLMRALAGRPGTSESAVVDWEGNSYRLDIAAAEVHRLAGIREKQGGPSIDASLATGRDDALGDTLMAWAYAVSIAGADSPVLLTGNAAKRHDFGLGPVERSARQRMAWALPRQDVQAGVPWHVSGSLLGLDLALSSLALRRVGADAPIEAPTLSTNEREAFAVSVALLNPFDLRDDDRDAIAAAIDRGRLRVATLAGNLSRLRDIASEVGMDGWRTRALQWMITHDPERIESMFSMSELLALGHVEPAHLDAWGMPAMVSSGCLCARLTPSNRWRLMIGRPQLGLMAETIADLNLHIASMLRELRLPAAVAKAVLSAAVQDFIDEAHPTDFNDWLTLVRSAQSVPRERVEDYVAVATSAGPLVPLQP
jgi:hypothetical protein